MNLPINARDYEFSQEVLILLDFLNYSNSLEFQRVNETSAL